MDAMTPMIEGADDQDIGSWLSSVRSDPVAFVEGAFAWGEGELAKSFGPEPWQLWLLEQIRDGLMTPGQAVRIAIASGHGVGKSAVCSWITLWAMSTAPDTRGIVTASSEAMLMTRYRAELRTWFRRFRAKEYFAMGATSLIDESVIFPRKGRDCRSIAPQVFRGLPLDQLEDRVVMFMNAHPECRQIFVDGTGLGAGLVDHLIRRGYHVTDVQFASKPTEQIDGVRYSNQRCHIWGQLRHHLRYLCLPQSPALKEQLCAPMYEFNRAGEIQLESKEMLRRRGIPSGDLADALCCTYAGQISTLPVLDSAPRGVPWDYNPFDDQHMRPPEEPFVDRETGYQFRLKRWDNDGGFSIQDFQDAAASDALRIVWDEPQE